jgi:hypothetical protein
MDKKSTPAVRHIKKEKLNEIMHLKSMKPGCDRCATGDHFLYSYYIKHFFSAEDPPNPRQRQMILFMCGSCGHIQEHDLVTLLNTDVF